MLLTIIGIALIGVVINILLKNLKPELALLSSVVTCLIIMGVVLEMASGIITKIMTFISSLGVDSELFGTLFKVLGISYIIEFIVDIAEESGSSSIAGKVALVGKILIAGMSLPMLFKLINLLLDLI